MLIGKWKVSASRQLIYDGGEEGSYRICNESNKDGNPEGIEVIIDGSPSGDRLLICQCRDVVGTKIEVNQSEGTESKVSYWHLN